MAKIIKALQSEGGFSVSEEPIIDVDRNVLKANSVQVVNNTFADAIKTEFISFNKANDTTTSVTLEPLESVAANTIVFSKSDIVLSWKGYVVAQYSANASDNTAIITLTNHGLSEGDSVTLIFDAQGSLNDGTYTVTSVQDENVVLVDCANIFDNVSPIVNGTVEYTQYGLYWELSAEVSTTCLSDASQTLILAGVSKTILKDNIPLGHTWDIEPFINNTTKEFGYQITITSNGSIELQSDGVECVGFVTNVSAVRD